MGLANDIADGDPIATIFVLFVLFIGALFLVISLVLWGAHRVKKQKQKMNEAGKNKKEIVKEYAKLKDFVKFIEYMFFKDFTILPKICLAVDSTRRYNPIEIRKLTVTYIYDFSKWDNKDPSDKEIDFEYDSQVKFEMQVNNCDLPGEYIRYAGNMYANELVPVYQKYGNSSVYTKVAAKKYRDSTEIKANIAQYSWDLSRRNIGGGPTFDMKYYWKYREKWDYKANKAYKETGKAEGKGILIHYPIHYGKSIEEFEIKVVFEGKRVRVTDIVVERIGKKGKAQEYGTTQITGDKKWIADNQISFSFTPKVDKCEAIYAKVEWILREDG